VRGDDRARKLTLAQYLQLEHVIVGTHDGVPSDIDVSLAAQGLTRKVVLRSPAFSLVPQLVAETDLVSTTVPSLLRVSGFASRLRSAPLPLAVAPGMGSMVWHERARAEPAQRWFRAEVERAYGSGVERLQDP
jgi:DNA-binding transcriptional LysR family regulator